MKNCNICNTLKPFSEFSRSNTKRGDGYQYTCKPCNTSEKRKWRNSNVDKNRNSKYLKKFGLTLNEVKSILSRQNNKCAICSKSIEMGSKTHLDHDHKTNAVRGFLCQKCNHGLGLFDDSHDILKSAVKYLKKYSVKTTEK